MPDLTTLPPDALRAKLDEIEQRANRATPGPWYSQNPDDSHYMSAFCVRSIPDEPNDIEDGNEPGMIAVTLLQMPGTVGRGGDKWEEDADFIAAARTDIPALVALARTLLAERDAAVAERDRPHEAMVAIGNFVEKAEGHWRNDKFNAVYFCLGQIKQAIERSRAEVAP